MTRRAAAESGKGDQHSSPKERITVSKLVSSYAASPWALSCTTFVMTALLIRSNDLSIF